MLAKLKRHWVWTSLVVIGAYVLYKYMKDGGIRIFGTSYMAPLDLTK